MQKVGTCPVEHRHEVVTDAVDALSGQIAQRLLIHLYLIISVGTTVFNGFYYRQALHNAPSHAVALDILTQLVYLRPCPHFAEWHVMKGCYDALDAYLS